MWSTYNYAVSDFPFIQIGFVMGIFAPFLLMFTYPIVKHKPKAWAQRYVGIVAYGYMGLGILDVIYGVVTGQFKGFLTAFGWGTLIEFFVMATVFFLAMLIMANKAVAGLKDSGKDFTPSTEEDDGEDPASNKDKDDSHE